jgi:hypothetical protein
MKHIKKFESFGEKVIQFRDHRGSKIESESTKKEYTKQELQKHLNDLYPGNTGFIISEYGDEYMVKVEMDGRYYPAGYCDSKFEDDSYYSSSDLNPWEFPNESI